LIDGVEYKQLYPPGTLLIHVPLVWWKGADWQAAGRIWFHLSLLLFGGLAALVWRLLRRIADAPLAPAWALLFYVCLLLQPGIELGLERGHVDVVMAVLSYAAVVCCLHRRWGTAVFLSICATSIKGYPVIFCLGIGLLTLSLRRWKQALLGTLAAFALVVLPVAHLLVDAFHGSVGHAGLFWPFWYNHGFLRTVHFLNPKWAATGRLVLSGFALVVSVMAWIQAWRAMRFGSSASRALWLSLFAAASLSTMIGVSALSISYNLCLVLPGALILAASQRRMESLLVLPTWGKHLLGVALLATCYSLFITRYGLQPPPLATAAPAAGFGLIGLFIVLFAVLMRALFRPVERWD
jgi:hypothetical protein